VNSILYHNRFLLARRISQITILVLFIGSNLYGWRVLRGNLSSSKILQVVPLADPYAVLQIAATSLIVGADALVGALTVLLFFGLFAGRSFCGWICPINLVSDGAFWSRRTLGMSHPERTLPIGRNLRYWALGLSIVLSVITGVAAFESISPVAILVRGAIFGFGSGVLVILALFLFDLAAVQNGFCGYVCPLGAFYSIVARFSILRVGHDHERCTLCMRCVERCPENQVLALVGKVSGPIAAGECTLCGRCIDVCDAGAMKIATRFGSLKG